MEDPDPKSLKQRLLELCEQGGSEAEMIDLISSVPYDELDHFTYIDAAEVVVKANKDQALSAVFNAASRYDRPQKPYLKNLAHRCSGFMKSTPQLSVKCLDIMMDNGFDVRSNDAFTLFMEAASREDKVFCNKLFERGVSSVEALRLAELWIDHYPKAQTFLKSQFPWVKVLSNGP